MKFTPKTQASFQGRPYGKIVQEDVIHPFVCWLLVHAFGQGLYIHSHAMYNMATNVGHG